jgi:hypothetical protein
LAAGAEKVAGEAIALTGTVQNKIMHLIEHAEVYDLLFIHRDSDSRDQSPRYEEIRAAAQAAGWSQPLVCVVPVQATEAWLLTDEVAIREVAGKKNGRADLALPPVGAIERTANPKNLLKTAYMTATETTGRKRATAERLFTKRRATLLERLDLNGDVTRLASFQRLSQDIASAVSRLLSDPSKTTPRDPDQV